MSNPQAQFLDSLFYTKPADAWIDVRGIDFTGKADKPVVERFFRTPAEVQQFIMGTKQPYDWYVGVAPRAKREGNKGAVERVGWLWADMDDSVLSAEGDKFLAFPPTMVVQSGHGKHVYWKLSEDLTGPEAEELLKMLCDVFSADRPAAEYARILRVPGTTNKKQPDAPVPVELVYINTDRVFDVEDVRGYLHALAHPATHKRGSRDSWLVEAMNQPESLLKDMRRRDSGKTRSDLDWKVACVLLDPGITEVEVSEDFIEFLYHNTEWGNRDDKAKNPEYLRKYTFPKARNHVAAEGDKRARKPKRKAGDEDEETGPLFTVVQNRLYYMGELIADFWIEPKMLLRSENAGEEGQDAMLVTLHSPHRSAERILSVRNVSTVASLNAELGSFDFVWHATSDKPLRQYMSQLRAELNERGLPVRPYVSKVGRHKRPSGDVWVGTDVTFDENGPIPDEAGPPIFFDPGHSVAPLLSYPFDPETFQRTLHELNLHISSMNAPEVIWPIMGWLTACHYKTALQRFPILHVFAQAGSGKTAMWTDVFLRMLGYREPLNGVRGQPDLNNFRFNILASATTTVPIVFDEYRASTTNPALLALLRGTYDGNTNIRGKANLGVKEFHPTSPIVLQGEDRVNEQAMMERSVIVSPRKADIADVGVNGGETIANRSFHHIRNLDLGYVAGPWAQYCLDNPLPLDEGMRLVRAAFSEGLGDRLRDNLAIVTAGLLVWRDFLLSHGKDTRLDLTPTFVRAIFLPSATNVVNLETGTGYAACDEFVTDIINFALRNYGQPKQEFIWQTTADGVFVFQSKQAYDWWKLYRHQRGEAVLQYKSVVDQLTSRIALADNSAANYVMFSERRIRAGMSRPTMTAISLPRAARAGLGVPDEMYPRSDIEIEDLVFQNVA